MPSRVYSIGVDLHYTGGGGGGGFKFIKTKFNFFLGFFKKKFWGGGG